MTKCLIKPYGYVGDTLFASGVAKKLKEEGQFDEVDFLVGFKQAEDLLKLNPYIDNVFFSNQGDIAPKHGIQIPGYDAQFELSPTVKTIPPPKQFQMECGVRNSDARYKVWTDPRIDYKVAEEYGSSPFVAVMEETSWEAKAFVFTEEEYERGVNVPYLGYGGKLRDINSVINGIRRYTSIVEVGLQKDVNSIIAHQSSQWVSLLYTASVLKRAKYFIGAEGGMANLAAGVGTKTILTGEFVHQLYGWNGVITKAEEPKLGPRYYFPDAGHIDLNPYLTDEQVVEEIGSIVNGEKTSADYGCNWTRRLVSS